MNPNEKPGTSEFLEITAAAAGGKHPKVSGVAYGGGKMTLWGWSKPVVVDLAGMTVPEEVPLLADHENHTLGRVGVVRAKPVDGHLAIEGEIVAEGEVADAIVSQAKAGAAWQLSIGAEVEASELVQEGRRTVNVDPTFTSEVTDTSPPCIAVRFRTTARPSPVPCTLFTRLSVWRENDSYMCSINSSLMPMPVSATM